MPHRGAVADLPTATQSSGSQRHARARGIIDRLAPTEESYLRGLPQNRHSSLVKRHSFRGHQPSVSILNEIRFTRDEIRSSTDPLHKIRACAATPRMDFPLAHPVHCTFDLPMEVE